MPRTVSVLGGGRVSLDPEAFEARFNMSLVHETVRAELNARRRGTASTRTRGQVSGGGAKPWRQKGTGRARAGSSRSPLWTGGGTVFGPTPRRYTVKVNRKARRAALRSVLSLHAGRDSLAVFDAGAFTEPSTKQAVELLEKWGPPTPPEPTLVLLDEAEAAAGKSFRNLVRVEALPVEDAGVADIVGAASLLVSERALRTLVALAGSASGLADADGQRADAEARQAGVEADAAGGEAGQAGVEAEAAGAIAGQAGVEAEAAGGGAGQAGLDGERAAAEADETGLDTEPAGAEPEPAEARAEPGWAASGSEEGA
jgi:large subunit ribosomal protein L4